MVQPESGLVHRQPFHIFIPTSFARDVGLTASPRASQTVLFRSITVKVIDGTELEGRTRDRHVTLFTHRR